MNRIRFYYTFNELIKEDATVESFQEELFNEFGITFTEGTNTRELYKSLKVKYGDDYILYIDVGYHGFDNIVAPTIEELKTTYFPQVRRQLNKIKEWLNSSQFRYDSLIAMYESQKNNLLEPIKNKSKTKFNDTPQATNTGLEGDEFATTFTVNENEADGVSKINRLNEIRLYWNSVFDEWQNEFGKKFVIYL